MPVYWLLDDKGKRSGNFVQLQARSYDALCEAARSEGSTKRPPRHDADSLVEDEYYEAGMIEVTTQDGATALLPSGSELYARVASTWREISNTLQWTECAPPDR